MEAHTSAGCAANKQTQNDAAQQAALTLSLDRIKQKYLVMSGKGGVGKTSVSVNLALTLASKGNQVGLMDVDIHGPDIPRMLGLDGQMETTRDHKLIPLKYSQNLRAISIEALMPSKDDAVIWRGPMKHSVIKQFVADVDWGELDYLIIDSPPGTGDEPLSVAQTVKDAQAIIVTTPQEVSLADVRKSINFCKTVQMDILGLVENMSGFTCPHCGEKMDLFGSGGGEITAQKAAIPFLGRIPFDPNLVACGDSGTSFVKRYSDVPATRALMSIADTMAVQPYGLKN